MFVLGDGNWSLLPQDVRQGSEKKPYECYYAAAPSSEGRSSLDHRGLDQRSALVHNAQKWDPFNESPPLKLQNESDISPTSRDRWRRSDSV